MQAKRTVDYRTDQLSLNLSDGFFVPQPENCAVQQITVRLSHAILAYFFGFLWIALEPDKDGFELSYSFKHSCCFLMFTPFENTTTIKYEPVLFSSFDVFSILTGTRLGTMI